MAADQGTGTTIVWSGSGGHPVWHTASGTVTFLDVSGTHTRDVVETTHLGTTTSRTFEPADLYDPGEITITADFDATNWKTAATSNFLLGTGTDTVTITMPNGSVAGSMFCTSLNWGPIAVNERMQVNFTMKVTGDLTLA